MDKHEAVLSRVRNAVESDASIDDVLRSAVAAINEEYAHYHWVGVYLLEGDHLTLHNYIGKHTDHTRIPVGKGVCGTAVAERANQVIGDVTALDNYLACSIETRSEIVVLIRRGAEIFGQIDIDSDMINAFSDRDESQLTQIADLLATRFTLNSSK